LKVFPVSKDGIELKPDKNVCSRDNLEIEPPIEDGCPEGNLFNAAKRSIELIRFLRPGSAEVAEFLPFEIFRFLFELEANTFG